MIVLKRVGKEFGKKESLFTALRNVDLEVANGSTLAIVGKSGSGKSTLMHLMSGLDHATSGLIEIDGKEFSELSAKEIDRFRAERIGFIFQSFFVESNQSCYNNIALPLEIKGVAHSRRRRLVEDALKQVDLTDKTNTPAGKLSGGQKQRLAIARAIVNKPKYIFADEPTGNLDSATGEKIVKLLFDLNKNLGATLCIVTHDSDLAARCEDQITMKDGRIIKRSSSKRKAAK